MKPTKKIEKTAVYTDKLKRILKKDDLADFDSNEILNAAYDKLDEAEYDAARDLFLISIKMDGYSADALNGLAIALCEKGETCNAMTVIKKAVELYPDDAVTLANTGTIFAENGIFAEAVGYYEKSLDADPGSPETYLGLIDLYMMFGNCAMAFLTCRRAAELLPDDEDINETMKQVLLEMAVSL